MGSRAAVFSIESFATFVAPKHFPNALGYVSCVRACLRALQRARLAHTRNVQRDSLKQMKLGQLTSRAGIWLRELVIGTLPPSVLQKKLRASNVFNVGPWLDRFRALKAKRRQA